MNITDALFKQVSKVSSLTTQLGPRGAAVHVARRLRGAVRGTKSFRVFLIVNSEPSLTAKAVAAAHGHTFRFATREELEALHRDASAGVHRWDLEAAANGCRCLLQLDGPQLVGYAWVSSAPLTELMWGLHFNLPDDMAYNYNGFTAPKYRGIAFQAIRHVKLLELLRAEGKTRLFAYVDELNYRSLRGVQKSGYRRVGVLTGVKAGGKTRFSLSVDEDAWSEQVRSGPSQHQGAASKIVQ